VTADLDRRISAVVDDLLPRRRLKVKPWPLRRFNILYGFGKMAEVQFNERADLVGLLTRIALKVAGGLHNGMPLGPLLHAHLTRERTADERSTATTLHAGAEPMAALHRLRCDLSARGEHALESELQARGVDLIALWRGLDAMAEVISTWPQPEPAPTGNAADLETAFRVALWEPMRAADVPRKTAARIVARLLVELELRPADTDLARLSRNVEQSLVRFDGPIEYPPGFVLWSPTKATP